MGMRRMNRLREWFYLVMMIRAGRLGACSRDSLKSHQTKV